MVTFVHAEIVNSSVTGIVWWSFNKIVPDHEVCERPVVCFSSLSCNAIGAEIDIRYKARIAIAVALSLLTIETLPIP